MKQHWKSDFRNIIPASSSVSRVIIAGVLSFLLIACTSEETRVPSEEQNVACNNGQLLLDPARLYGFGTLPSPVKAGARFGFPLPDGCIKDSDDLSLYAVDPVNGSRTLLKSKFTALQRWRADVYGFNPTLDRSEGDYIRWLQVAATVDMSDGVAPALEIDFVGSSNQSSRPEISEMVQQAIPLSIVDPDPDLERFNNRFRLVYNPGPLLSQSTDQELYCDQLAKSDFNSNSVYKSFKVTGSYRYINSVTGEEILVGNCDIRVFNFLDTGTERIYHTFTWLLDSNDKDTTNNQIHRIVSLDYVIENPVEPIIMIGSSNDTQASPRALTSPSEYTQFRESVISQGISEGKLIQWVEFGPANERTVISTRWSEVNYPNGVEVQAAINGSGERLHMRLLGFAQGVNSFDMSERQLAANQLRDLVEGSRETEVVWSNGNIRGLSKTHEIVINSLSGNCIGANDTRTECVQTRNAFIELSQKPLIYAADRGIMAASNQPTRWSPTNVFSQDPIDQAIELSLLYVREAADLYLGNTTNAPYGDKLGWVYHGARNWNYEIRNDLIPFQFRSPYRYWNNHDGISGNLAWIQWLRTGAEHHLEFAETNSRHLMDLATYNGPEPTAERDTFNPGAGAFHKAVPGAQYHYAATPWGLFTNGFAGFISEADYLQSYCFILGYDRACEHLMRRQREWCRFDVPITNSGPFGANSTRAQVARLHELMFHLRDPVISECEDNNGNTVEARNALLAKAELVLQELSGTEVKDYTHNPPALIDTKFGLAADYVVNPLLNTNFRQEIKDQLTKIYDRYGYYGDPPANTLWTVESVYPLLNRYDDYKLVDPAKANEAFSRAFSIGFGHAQMVVKNNIDSWLGRSITPFHFLGGDVREWITLDAYRDFEMQDFDLSLPVSPSNLYMIEPGIEEPEPDQAPELANRYLSYTLCTPDVEGTLRIYASIFGDIPGTSITVTGPNDFSVSKQVPVDVRDVAGFEMDIQDESITIENCVLNGEYEIDLNVGPAGNGLVARAYALTSNSGKLVHLQKDNFITTASIHIGGTVWVKVHDLDIDDDVEINAHVAMRRLANGGTGTGKIVAVKFANNASRLIDDCASVIIGTTSDGRSIQDDCSFIVKNNTLVGITHPMNQNERASGNVVLKESMDTDTFPPLDYVPKPFGLCTSSILSEYYDSPRCNRPQ